jgi:hypothetical protein
MSPWLNRTLHLRLAPRMNLRVHSGHDKLGMASCALLISIRRFTIGKPTMNSPTETLTYALYHADVAVPPISTLSACDNPATGYNTSIHPKTHPVTFL